MSFRIPFIPFWFYFTLGFFESIEYSSIIFCFFWGYFSLITHAFFSVTCFVNFFLLKEICMNPIFHSCFLLIIFEDSSICGKEWLSWNSLHLCGRRIPFYHTSTILCLSAFHILLRWAYDLPNRSQALYGLFFISVR